MEGERERKGWKRGEEGRREISNSDTGMSVKDHTQHTNLTARIKYTEMHLNCLPLRG